jgi:methylenetetrahydrofolate reductase (NADPH)
MDHLREMHELTFTEDLARFEVFPAGSIDAQAAELPREAQLTVTCSPVHGPDHSLEVAGRFRELDHPVTVHVAARMVRDRAHLDALLAGMSDVGVDDLFLIGGDIKEQQGEYSSAVELLPLIDEHPQRPYTIGIAAYPEDHPFISDKEIEDALREKCRFADYVTTQMCFDPDALRDWVVRHRERGLTLPVVIGMPGKVKRKRLLAMSTQIGVGPSLRFLRKQRGLLSLLSRRSTADRLYDAFAPMLDDPNLRLAGFNYYTFNQLVETWEWHQKKLDASDKRLGRRKENRRDSRQPAGAPGRIG